MKVLVTGAAGLKYERKPGWFPLIARAPSPQALLIFRYTDGT
jgi:hypothetical protein